MKSINFSPEIYQATTNKNRKSGTIQLGDQARHYEKDELVWITTGNLYSGKRKLFTAFIDRIYVKKAGDLTRHDLAIENLIAETQYDAPLLLSILHKVPVNQDDLVTVIQFSEVLD